MAYETLGPSFAARVLEIGRHVRLREIATETGDGAPRTARVKLSQTPVRDAEDLVVRQLVLLVMSILEMMRPCGRHYRAQHKALWWWHLCRRMSARPEALSRRELSRYLAVVRETGLIACRQPPPVDGRQQYQVYEIHQDALPPAVDGAMRAFYGQRSVTPPPEVTRTSARGEGPPPPPRALSPSEHARATERARELLEQYAPPD